MLKIFIIAITALALCCGCASTGSRDNIVHDAYVAAAADTATTLVAVNYLGGHELNPLGVVGTAVAKSVYLFGIRPGLTPESRVNSDRTASTVWYGAAASNLVQILLPGFSLGSLVMGGLVSYHVWTYRPVQPTIKD